MSEYFERSPRGYAYLKPAQKFPKAGEVIRFNPTLERQQNIEALWSKYLTIVGPTTPTHMVLLLISYLKESIGDLRQWLWVQVSSNDLVHGYSLDFLKDTINYVNTGHRELSIDTWYNVIDSTPTKQSLDVNARLDTFKNITILSTDEFLSRWLTHENGVRDMFQTAHLLFGKVKP